MNYDLEYDLEHDVYDTFFSSIISVEWLIIRIYIAYIYVHGTHRDVVSHGGTNAKMTVSTENSHFLVNYSHLD